MKGLIKKLLREGLLGEGVIELPREVTQKFGVLYDLLKTNIEDYKQKALNRKYNNPYKAFNDYFKLTDRANKPLNVSVSLYDDPSDAGLGRMDTVNDTVLLNLSHFNDYEVDFLEYILYHELVHAMDPLVRDVHLFSKYYNKKGAEPTGQKLAVMKTGNGGYKSEYQQNLEKYKKSQHEYTAFLSTLVSKIKIIFGTDETKLKWLWWFIDLLKDFKNYNDMYDSVVQHIDNMRAAKLFNTEQDLFKFIDNLFDAKEWVGDDEMKKKFKNDVYKSLTKTK